MMRVQAICDMLRGHNINLKQETIDYMYKKDMDYLASVIRAINSPDNVQVLQMFSNSRKSV
jgi:hypothetical protein